MLFKTMFKALGITSLTMTSGLLINLAPATSQAPDQVTFVCKPIHDEASGEKIPATLVWVPELQQHRRLIGWKSQYFDKTLTAQQRCEKVTQKFQTFYDNGTLQYITYGQSSGLPILCAVKNIGDACTNQNQLFTLLPYRDPKQVQQGLTDIINGKSGGILMQSSGDQAYIPFADVLKNSPVVSESTSRP